MSIPKTKCLWYSLRIKLNILGQIVLSELLACPSAKLIDKVNYLELLFVDEAHRNKGLATILLQRVEKEAKAMGVSLVHTDSYEFQAKDFYLKQGYEVFGVLNDCPQGYTRYYLKKNL